MYVRYLFIWITKENVYGNQIEVAAILVFNSSARFFILLYSSVQKVCEKEFFLDAMYEKVYGTVNL